MSDDRRLLAWLAPVLLLLEPRVARGGDEVDASRLPPPAGQAVDFARDIYPILTRSCFRCHQGADASSGIRLDVRPELLGETNGKPVVEVGHSARSRLIHLVAGLVPNKVMPARGARLTPAEVGLLRAWIDQGVAWDEKLLPPLARSEHWAFQAVRRPPVPAVKDPAWARNPVDALIAARHVAEGLTPSPPADRAVLIRRLSFDLTGLPPSPEEVEAFVADVRPDAYEQLVERLLASPHYGERWGRHWLDLARYADSEGYESDHVRPYAWRYRDYVVRSFNADKPYDRFLREQVAGDELLPYADDNLIATGFLAAARLSSNEEDRYRQRNDVLVDIVNATGSAVLGLTLNCAQCHNHKFDPITARDYYRFQGFFVRGAPNNLALQDPAGRQAYEAARPREYEAAKQLQQALFDRAKTLLVASIRKKLTPAQLQLLDKPTELRNEGEERAARALELQFQLLTAQVERAIPEEDRTLYDELKKKVAALEKSSLPDRPQTFGFYSPASSPTAVEVLPMKGFYPPPYDPEALKRNWPYLLIAGDVHRRGPALDVGWPAVFGPSPAVAVARHPRTTLADWLASPDNPLTARVWVNRLWHYHFGRGIVATPGDFGVRGARPSHPELLDWLASELMASGWSTKHLHRLIVTARTYRQAAGTNPDNERRDPDNRFWWRWPVRRLEVEAIRDAQLAASGELDRAVGGPPMADDGKGTRRTLYFLQKRQKAPAVQTLFDGPSDAAESCQCRHVSTVPLQALYLLNNDFTLQRARVLAERVYAQAGTDPRRQAEVAFRAVLGRSPDAAEQDAAQAFFAATAAAATDRPPTLVQFCQALLNLNEFVYLE